MQSLTSRTQSTDAKIPSAALLQTREFLAFNLGAEEFGIDILKVQEIRCYEKPTRMAGVPDFIKGVVNLRGVIVPIIAVLLFGYAAWMVVSSILNRRRRMRRSAAVTGPSGR